MSNKKDQPRIDLQRFRNHKKGVPWDLVRKVIIGLAVLGLFYYIYLRMNSAAEQQSNSQDVLDEVEVDVEL